MGDAFVRWGIIFHCSITSKICKSIVIESDVRIIVDTGQEVHLDFYQTSVKELFCENN